MFTVIGALWLFVVSVTQVLGVGAPSPWVRFSLRDASWAHVVRKIEAPAFAVKPEELKKIRRLIWARHQIKPTDNIWKLAMNYGTSVESIQSSNAAELIWMKPGSDIVVLNKRGTLHHVKQKNGQGETLADVARLYGRRDNAAEQKLKAEIVKANSFPGYALLADFELNPGSYLLIPDTYLEFDTFRIPFKYWHYPRISSGFGLRYHPILKRKKFHDGMDFPQAYNTPVYASRSGRVIFANWREGYGLMVIIKHSDGTTTRYGHLSRIYVKDGQWVEGGKKMIARVGSTGLSTGPHLHFEIRDHFGRPLNPKKKFGKK